MTKWKIEPSFKYEALCFLNIMTGDVFYLNYYPGVYEKFKSKLTPEVTQALSSLHKKVKEDNNKIISAWLCLNFSAVEDSTIEEMISSVNNHSIMKVNLKNSPYYDEDSWKVFLSVAG